MSTEKGFRKVAFAEIAVQRLQGGSVSGGRNLNRPGDLKITIERGLNPTLEEQQGDSFASLDSESSETYTESDVGRPRGRITENLSPRDSSWKSSGRSLKSEVGKDSPVPELAITLFAFRLAVLEKTSRGAGTLTFVWATVVLLGGFSSYINKNDFWVVTILILTEGSRIFFLSNELEWQRARFRSSFSLYELGSNFARRSNRYFSGLVHHSPSPASSGSSGHERPLPSPFPYTPNGVPGYGTPLSQAPSPAPEASKRAQRIAVTLETKPATRTWSASVLPLLPYTQIVSAKGMAVSLYICQLVSALLCLALSLWRLAMHDFLDVIAGAGASKALKENVAYSVYAFYVMALIEAFIFLIEKMYWEYKINFKRLFLKVDERAQLKDVDTIISFFYQVYSRSLAVSIFTGLEMDLVSYSMELLQSNDAKEVLGGTRVLKTFVGKSHAFHGDTLRRIGITPGAIDRLVEMLAWHHKDEKEIRLNSAVIVKALVSSTRNSSRVIAVSGSLENIMSLIQWDDVDKILHVGGRYREQPPLEVFELHSYGLGILKCLAQDHANCLRIGETRGLLAKLVDFINVHGNGNHFSTRESCKTIRQSLKLLKMLASTTGRSGSTLRTAIANVVSAIPHLRDILHTPETQLSKNLHEYAVDVLMYLALDKLSREVIGSTGGVISNLMLLFTRRSLHLKSFVPEETSGNKEVLLAKKAGRVLMRLSLQSKDNCNRILRTRFKEPRLRASTVMLQILRDDDEELGILAAQILRGTYTYMSPAMQEELSRHSEFLLKRVISSANRRVKEAALGLTIAVPSLDEEFRSLFDTQGVDRNVLVNCLLECLRHVPSTTRRPRVRRYSLELIYCLLNRDEATFKGLFFDKGLPSLLMKMLDNISDVENYLLFSGGMGLTRHKDNMEDLVLRVLNMFDDVNDRELWR